MDIKEACRQYDEKTAGMFVDGELDQKRAGQFREHIRDCGCCRNLVALYSKVGNTLASNAADEVSFLEHTAFRKKVFEAVRKKERKRVKRFPGTSTPLKNVLKPAFIAAIIISGAFLLYSDSMPVKEPSAIVNSVYTDTASVMIMETRKEKHTIIWFSGS